MSYAFIDKEGFLAAKCSTVPLEFYSGGEKKGYRFSYKGSYVTTKNYGIKFFRRNDCVGKLWSESKDGPGFTQNIEVIGYDVKTVCKTLEEIEYYIGAKDVPLKDSPKRKVIRISDIYRKQKNRFVGWFVKVGKFFYKQAISIYSFFVCLRKKITQKRSSSKKEN